MEAFEATARRPASRDLWYAPDPRIETAAAAHKAVGVFHWIQRGSPGEAKPELELFAALHTCAFRASRASQGRDGRESSLWADRWWTIREHLVGSNLGLVHLMIKRYRSTDLDEDDLMSDGMYGLVRAVEKYNPWKGYRFSTYACNVIARAMMRRAKAASGYHRRFPIQQEAVLERPEPPADSEVELRVERLQHVMSCNLGDLSDLESMVLAQRFPEDGPRRTYEQIGEGIGLSKERIRQIQNVALGKLRNVMKGDPLLS